MKVTWTVTGAAGFIGSNLCAELLAHGYRVVGLDNFATGTHENIRRVSGRSKGNFKFIEGDIRNLGAVSEAVVGADNVVHLAAQGSVQRSFSEMSYNNDVNVTGFLNVIEASASAGVKTFIYASSCSVYGEQNRLPIQESDPASPMSPYAASKLINEHYGFAAAKTWPAMNVVGLRFFNIFGPWQDPQGPYAAVIPKWIDLLLREGQATIFGDGSATRDFCFVGNVCRLVVSVGALRRGCHGAVYNVGSGVGTSLVELHAVLVREIMRRGCSIKFVQPCFDAWRSGEIRHSRSNISAAAKELGYEPVIGLAEGIGIVFDEQFSLLGEGVASR